MVSCLETPGVEQAHDGTGQFIRLSKIVQVHTQCKNNFVPEENRDIASLNTENEFNRGEHPLQYSQDYHILQ